MRGRRHKRSYATATNHPGTTTPNRHRTDLPPASQDHCIAHAGHAERVPPRPALRTLQGGARQGLLAVLDQGVVGGTNFLSLIAVGRYDGGHELGLFALALTFIFLAIAAEESLLTVPYTVLVRRLAGKKKRCYAGGTLVGCLGLALGLAAAAMAAAWLLWLGGAPRETLWLGIALGPALGFWLLREAARRFAYADFRARGSLSTSLAVAVVQLSLIGWLAGTQRLSAVSALIAITAGNGVAALVWLVVVRREVCLERAEIVMTLARNWRLGKWMFAGQIATTLGLYALPWIVAMHQGTAGAGAFAACASVIRLASPFLVALTNVLTPQAAQAFSEAGAPALARVVRAAAWIATLFTGLFCLTIVAVGDWLLSQFFGTGYSELHWTLVLLAVSLVTSQFALATGRGLLVLERTRDGLKADLVSSGITLGGAALLTPAWGLTGAAAGVLAGGVTGAALTYHYYRSALGSLPVHDRPGNAAGRAEERDLAELSAAVHEEEAG